MVSRPTRSVGAVWLRRGGEGGCQLPPRTNPLPVVPKFVHYVSLPWHLKLRICRAHFSVLISLGFIPHTLGLVMSPPCALVRFAASLLRSYRAPMLSSVPLCLCAFSPYILLVLYPCISAVYGAWQTGCCFVAFGSRGNCRFSVCFPNPWGNRFSFECLSLPPMGVLERERVGGRRSGRGSRKWANTTGMSHGHVAAAATVVVMTVDADLFCERKKVFVGPPHVVGGCGPYVSPQPMW